MLRAPVPPMETLPPPPAPSLPARLAHQLRAGLGGLPRAYWLIWTGTLVNRAGTFVVPYLMLYLTGTRGLSKAEAGDVLALHGLGALLAAFLGGWLADRLGRKPTLVLALWCGAAAMVLLAFARAPLALALGVFVLGLLGETYRPAVAAAIADVVPPRDRARAFSLFYWVINLGFTVALLLAAELSRFGFTWLFLGDAATTALYGVILVLLFRETRPPPPPGAAPGARGPGPFAPFGDPVFVAFFFPVLALALVFFQHLSTLPLTLSERGLGAQHWGRIIAVNGVLIVLLQPWASALARRMRRAHALALACLLAGAGFGLHAVDGGVWLAVGAVAVWTAGEILHAPVAAAVVADLAPAHQRGAYQGAFYLAWGTAQMLAPALGNRVLEAGGPRVLWTGCFALCAVAAAVHLAVGPARRRHLAALQPDVAPAD